MHIGDSPEEAEFRALARGWLSQHAAPRTTGQTMHFDDLAEHVDECRAWQRTLHDHGWAGISWPAAFGGRGASPIQSAIFNEEQGNFAVATGAFAVAIGMVGPTLIAHGTPEQQAEFLPGMLRGDHVWCQLFSEPGAGSDLASLQCKAERDGDEFVITGQKVWCTGASVSDYIFVGAKTGDDESPSSINLFKVDRGAPGLSIGRKEEKTGARGIPSHPLFLDDVFVPRSHCLGEEQGGFKLVMEAFNTARPLHAARGVGLARGLGSGFAGA